MIDFIKDADCTKETPVKLGVPDAPIYGKGIKLKPRVDGRTDSEHFKKIYLPELLPLEEYDLIVVLISGGKDSVACYLKLLELGVPKERIEFWHHDIDGGHPSRRMDWKCTQNYVKALADAEGIKLRVSYRVNGFFGELYRIGASEPIEWIDPDTGEVKQCKLSSNYLKCKELKEQATEEMEELLKKYGYRMKFPAKTGDLSRRWCSAYLKICVADTVVSNLDRLGELEELGGKRHKFPAKGGTHSGRWCSGNLKAAVQDSVTANLEETKRDKKILIVSGERRGESAGRSKYNEMEIHRTNAEAKAHRIVHQWRCCIDYSEKDVWELLKRHHINPHPCYRIGWNKERKSAEQSEPVQDGTTNTDSESVTLDADTYFYVPADDNYVMKHKGDTVDLIVDGVEVMKVISKEEFGEGVKRLAQADNPKPENPIDGAMNPPEKGRRTRRSAAQAQPDNADTTADETPAVDEQPTGRTRRVRKTR